MHPPHLAYVFERFPTFTQTFCVREVMELQRLGLRPMLFSIRNTSDEPLEEHFPPELIESVEVLPPREQLVELVNEWKCEDRLPQEAVLTLRHWGGVQDKSRVYEAIYIGAMLREAGVRHAHTHFAGVGARCCFWLKRFYGIEYSFTGHANDLFERQDFEVSLDDLVAEAAMVVTVSDYTKGWLNERFPRFRGKVKRIYNGLDLAPFEKVAKGTAKLAPARIVSVGRLIEKKGFDDLIRACARLRALQSTPFHCTIIGDGPLEDELAALIESEGVGDCVELAGAKSQPEIVEELAGATLFALPCVTERGGGKDNLPTVIMEAMAAALPCVSTRLAGVPEMVVHGETGLLTGEREPEDFARALSEVLNDPETAAAMGVAGQERARQLFAKQVTATELRRQLLTRCRLRYDRELGMIPAYISGWCRSMLRRLRAARASRFALAEKAAKRTR